MLQVRDLKVSYGGVLAVDGVDLEVEDAAVHGLIGPNGAGKTTALNAITAVTRAQGGSVMLDGRELMGASPASVLRAGISRTFQQARLWSGMTVLQNLTVPVLSDGRRSGEKLASEVAERLGFAQLLDRPAAVLPFGARRLVEVGRALMTAPRVLMLDEPGAGLTLNEKKKLIDVLGEVTTSGAAVLLVDHDMELVMQASRRVTVLDAGAVIAVGPPDEVRRDPGVLSVYLGEIA